MRYLGVIVPTIGPDPIALFVDERLGRQWAIDYFPSSHRTEILHLEKENNVKPGVREKAPTSLLKRLRGKSK